MIESLSFAVVFVILLAWIVAWSLIGVVVAAAKNQDLYSGLIKGITFGPIGVLFIALTQNEGKESSATQKFKKSPTTPHRERPIGIVSGSRDDLYK